MKTTRLLLPVVAVFISGSVYSQGTPPVEWIMDTISGHSNAVKTDADGNVYITGLTYVGSGWNDVDIMTVKYNSSGVQQWAVSYNGAKNKYDEGVSIDVDNNGNVYVAGFVDKENDSWSSPDSSDYCTIKYNADGVQQWAKVYSGSGRDIPFRIVVDGSGNSHVTGQSYIDDLRSDDMVTIKYDANGTQLWLVAHDGNGSVPEQDSGRDMVLDSQGNVYVFGHSTTATTWYDLCLVKYNSSGVQQFIQYYTGPNSVNTEYGVALTLDPDGNIYCIGELSDYNLAVLKFSPAGFLLWDYVYETPSIDNACDIAADGSGNVYFCGSSGGVGVLVKLNNDALIWEKTITGTGGNEIVNALLLDGDGNSYLTGKIAAGSYFDFVTEKVDASGTTLWRATHNGSGNFNDYGNAIAMDNAGNICVTGGSNVDGYNNICTIKYGALGGVAADDDADQNIVVYPNPTAGNVNIRFGGIASALNVKVTDVQGRIVCDRVFYADEFQLDISDLTKGSYFLNMTTADGLRKTAKFVIE